MLDYDRWLHVSCYSREDVVTLFWIVKVFLWTKPNKTCFSINLWWCWAWLQVWFEKKKKNPLFGQSILVKKLQWTFWWCSWKYYLLSLMTHRYREELSNYYNVINCNSCIGFWCHCTIDTARWCISLIYVINEIIIFYKKKNQIN